MRFLVPLLLLIVLPAAMAAPLPVMVRPVRPPVSTPPEMVLQLPQNGSRFSVAFTPDGSGLVTADGEKLRLWDNRTHDQLRIWQSPRHGASAATFTPDGKLVAYIGGRGSKSTTLVFRDPVTSKVARTLECGAAFDQFVFSPNGKTLAAGGHERNAVLIDTATGRTLHTLPRGKGTLSCLAFTPDSRSVWVGDMRGESAKDAGRGWIIHGDVFQVDTTTGKVGRTFHHARSGALSPDGHTLLVAGDRLTLWDTRSWKVLRSASLVDGEHDSLVAFSPDGRWIATGGGAEDGGRVTLRDSRTLRKLHQFYTDWAHQLAFSPGSDRVAVSAGHSISQLTIWDVRTGKQLQESTWEDDPINTIALHPDGRTLATGNGWYSSAGGGSTTHGHVALWNLATGQLTRRFVPRDNPSGLSWNCVSQVRFSGDGSVMAVATGQGSRGYSLWRYPALTPIRSWDGEVVWGERMALSADADTLVAGMETQRDDGTRRPDTRIWGARGGRPGRTLKDVRFLAAAPDARSFLAGAERNRLAVRDTATGKVLHTFSPAVAVTIAAYNPAGERVAVGHSDGSITLWNTANYRLVRTLAGAHLDEVATLAFSPDGRWLASAALTIKIWDLETGRVASTLRGATGAITELAFARGGAHVVAATSDRALQVWDRASGEMRVTLRELPSLERDAPTQEWIAYTPAGSYIGSPRAERFIRWRSGGKLLAANAYTRDYRSPERVAAALRVGP